MRYFSFNYPEGFVINERSLKTGLTYNYFKNKNLYYPNPLLLQGIAQAMATRPEIEIMVLENRLLEARRFVETAELDYLIMN